MLTIALYSFLLWWSTCYGRTFNLGVLAPTSGEWPIARTSIGAVTSAVDRVNSDPTFEALRAGNHSLDFIWTDTKCETDYGLGVLVDMWAENRGTSNAIDVFIGKSKRLSCRMILLLSQLSFSIL